MPDFRDGQRRLLRDVAPAIGDAQIHRTPRRIARTLDSCATRPQVPSLGTEAAGAAAEAAGPTWCETVRAREGAAVLTRLILWSLLMSVSMGAQNPCRPRLTLEQARENLKRAYAAHQEARKRANDATRELLHYQQRYPPPRGKPGYSLYEPPHPQWNESVEKQLSDRMEQRWAERADRFAEWRDAQEAAKMAARQAKGYGGPSLLSSPPPPQPGGSAPNARGGSSGLAPPGEDVAKTIPDPAWADTIPGRPPGIPAPSGPIYGPPAEIPSIPGGLPRDPFGKVAAGSAAVADSFWILPWR